MNAIALEPGMTFTPISLPSNRCSAQTDQVAAALALAQIEMANPAFDRENPHFRSKFASLAAVRNAGIPILAKHGIACTQNLIAHPGGVACVTTLWHKSGQWLEFGPLPIPATKNDAQGITAAGTYAKRVQLQAVLVIVGDEDDDGNEAVGKPAASTPIVKGDRSGRPDTSKVPPDAAIALADRMRETMSQQDKTEIDIARACLTIHRSLYDREGKPDDYDPNPLYTAAGDLLKPKEARAWKEWLAVARAENLNGVNK